MDTEKTREMIDAPTVPTDDAGTVDPAALALVTPWYGDPTHPMFRFSWGEPEPVFTCRDCPFELDDTFAGNDSRQFRAEEHARATGHHVVWMVDRADPEMYTEDIVPPAT